MKPNFATNRARSSSVRKALLLLVLASCATPRPVGPADDPPLVVGRSVGDGGVAETAGVRFQHPPAKVGARWRVALVAESIADGGGVTRYESEYVVEILAVEGPAPSRVKVHVDRNVNAYQGSEVPTVVHGKDYVVDVREPHVQAATGGVVLPSEAERVLAWFPDLGTRARLDEILPDSSMRVGDSRDELAAAILRVLHPTAWKLDAGRATLARADASVAEFDVTIATTSAVGMKMNVSGRAYVRLADASLANLEVAGRYEMGADAGRFEVKRTVTAEAAASSAR
jgi:hypothetical protein